MGYSFYEIYITAQRAFKAMGFPFGADEDAGFIIAWLELNHFNGIEILYNLIESTNQKYNGVIKFDNLDTNIDFKNTTILMKGSGLVDYLQSISNQKEKVSVNIKNCPDGILFLPLLYKISKKNNYIELNFSNSKNEASKYRIINKEIIFESLINQNSLTKKNVNILIKFNTNNLGNVSKQKIITKKIIQNNLAKSIFAKENLWKKILQTANKTFVPESEESRNKGAGGGDAND